MDEMCSWSQAAIDEMSRNKKYAKEPVRSDGGRSRDTLAATSSRFVRARAFQLCARGSKYVREELATDHHDQRGAPRDGPRGHFFRTASPLTAALHWIRPGKSCGKKSPTRREHGAKTPKRIPLFSILWRSSRA